LAATGVQTGAICCRSVPLGAIQNGAHKFGRDGLLLLFAQFYFIPAAVIPIAAPLTIDITPDNVWKSTYDTFSALHGINSILLIPTTILVLIMFSFAARHPWKTIGLTALLLLLLVLQFALALIGFQHSDLAPIAGLHGLNAILLVASPSG
jgi:Family of unknown function (DUF6220)